MVFDSCRLAAGRGRTKRSKTLMPRKKGTAARSKRIIQCAHRDSSHTFWTAMTHIRIHRALTTAVFFWAWLRSQPYYDIYPDGSMGRCHHLLNFILIVCHVVFFFKKKTSPSHQHFLKGWRKGFPGKWVVYMTWFFPLPHYPHKIPIRSP